jgi:hypothetical protein
VVRGFAVAGLEETSQVKQGTDRDRHLLGADQH